MSCLALHLRRYRRFCPYRQCRGRHNHSAGGRGSITRLVTYFHPDQPLDQGVGRSVEPLPKPADQPMTQVSGVRGRRSSSRTSQQARGRGAPQPAAASGESTVVGMEHLELLASIQAGLAARLVAYGQARLKAGPLPLIEGDHAAAQPPAIAVSRPYMARSTERLLLSAPTDVVATTPKRTP